MIMMTTTTTAAAAAATTTTTTGDTDDKVISQARGGSLVKNDTDTLMVKSCQSTLLVVS